MRILLKPWTLPLSRQCLLLFAIAFAARIALVLLTHQYRDLTRFELQRTAYSMATTGVFGNPYSIQTGPTAHVSPGYTLILAGIYRLFGAGERGELIKEVASSAVSSLGWAMLPIVGSVLGMPPPVGFIAALIAAVLPLKLSVETKGDWETPYSVLAVMLTACATVVLWRRRTYSVSEALKSGALWGACLLFMGALVPELLVFGAVGLLHGFSSRYIKFLAIQALVVALILAPWVIRNRISLGSPIATRSNLGLELRLSNNDLAGPLERQNFEKGVYHVYHPLQSVRQAEQVRALGEPEYNRRAEQEAFAWIRAHPARFAQLTAERILYFWFEPIPGQTVKAVWLWAMAIVGFAGLWLFLRADFWAALPLALYLLLLPLPSYLIHVGIRHRFPIDWICLLLAVYAVTSIARPSLRRSVPPRP